MIIIEIDKEYSIQVLYNGNSIFNITLLNSNLEPIYNNKNFNLLLSKLDKYIAILLKNAIKYEKEI